MLKNNLFKRLMSLIVCFAILAACLPVFALDAAAASTGLNIVENSKKADPDTTDGWQKYFGPNKLDTEFAGAVWTDKSVFAAASDSLPGVTLTDNNHFLVSLSAIASNLSITGHTSSPTDTMLVLDMSGSMVNDTYQVGTIRQGNSYQTANGIDMSLIEAMVDATNATIDKLMKQNTNNRVGVVLYSGNTSTNQDATVGTATVVLPLGRYTGIDGQYLSLDTTWRTEALYRYSGWRWQATGESATYVPSGTAVNVSVKNGLKTESGSNVTDTSKQANGGTYIQNGLYQAMNQFLDDSIDTIVPEDRPQAGAERMPVIVLMTDGAPTIATGSYNDVETSHIGDGTTTTDRITFMTQLTAAYVRGRVAAKYQENPQDSKDVLFLTLGLGTENSSAATDTLYPAGSNDTLTGYWNKFLTGNSGANVQIVTGNNGWSVYRDAAVEAMNYVDRYFYASNADGLINSFNEIFSEIELKAGSYATLVEGNNANFSGYVTFEDELGEMMQVSNVKGILMDDGQGGTVLYTGKGIAESMNNGNLGTVDGPTERGNELIRTVKERIPGTTTTQAQQLIDNAYNDQQLYYTDDSNWSNYIGWYADANGNYVGFWDKDSGYENAPANAVYANRSYGYLGVNGNSDMMHVVVMVRTELATLHQTVLFKIPASLLPTVQYNVTLAENDPTTVETFEQDTAVPMRLVFEVGLREGINSVNLEQKIAEHLERGGHIHRNNDGTVTFYTNEWAIGNDTNKNGIPDLDEIENAHVAESHFHPATDNTRYYYTEDIVVHDENGNPATGTTRPSGTGYHYDRYIYSESGRQVIKTPIAEITLENDAVYDSENGYWYIPAGTMYRNFARFKTPKTPNNPTGTLDYSFFPAVFENGEKQDVYTFLGNNGKFTVAPATGFTLNKQLDGTIDGVQNYTFQVTLSNIPSGATAAPLLTNANGDPMTGMSAYENNQFTVTLPADVTAYISGIPAGTTVQIAELVDGDYHVSKILVAQEDQTANGSASFTVPGGTKDGTPLVPVEFTNAPNQYGDLVIGKDVHHTLESDPEALASKIFTFHVTLSGDKINLGDTFDTSTGAKVKVAQDGSVTFEDGSAITLRNEESITIYRLPHQTHYEVTETQIPDGFLLTSATENSGYIVSNRVHQAAFVNTYPDQYVPASLPMQVVVEKLLDGNPPTPETFTFQMKQLTPEHKDLEVFTISSDAADKTDSALLTLEFDRLGAYSYQIAELTPGNPTPGMSYSTTQAMFSVIVTDDDMDGRLEIAVREDAHANASVDYTDSQNPETATQINISAEFTNIYKVHSTQVEVPVHKNLVNDTGVQIPLTEFKFGLYAVDGEGNATGDPISVITANADGNATFNLLIEENLDKTYIIKEIVPTPARVGMTYSPAEYILSIAVEADTDGQLSATTSIVLKGAEAEGETTPVFENTYKLDPAISSIPMSKTLVGRPLKDGETFGFYLVRTDDTYTPLTGSNAYNATYYWNSGNLSLPLGYDQNSDSYLLNKAGTYHYKLTEIAGSEGGMVYDPAEYRIIITVTDNGNGALVASTPVIHKFGQANAVTEAAFVNTYTVTGSGEVVLGGKKQIIDENGDPSNRLLTAGEFSFGLYSDNACTQLIEEVSNKADGTFSFSPITYTVADLGENNAPNTYAYYIKEIVPQEAVFNESTGQYERNGFAYDGSMYVVRVEVSHENGVLTVKPTAGYNALNFANVYKAKPVTVTLNGEKKLSGNWSAVTNKSFTFNLFEADASFAITNEAPVKTATVNGAEPFSMNLSYADGQEGFHYYVLKEVIPAQRAGGVGYDAGEYHITINITDPGDGQLVALTTIYRPGTGNVSTTDFTNVYTVEPTKITLVGEKSFTNTTNNQPKDMEEGDFSFVVLENGTPVAIGYNKADGSIYFPEIHYSEAGEHTYKIVEVPGEEPGVAYDTTEHTVVVTVTDNGDGTLTAVADYNNSSNSVIFENTYTPGAAQVKINGIKTFSGDWSKVPAANKVFTFGLYPADNQFNITGEALDQTTNTDGTFEFLTRSYNAEGTHYYVVKEIAGTQNIGIAYSDAEIHITVKVDDNGNGKLIPTVTTDFNGATVTAEPGNASIVTLSSLEFVNTYSVEPISQVLTATKAYDGKNMLDFQFDLTGTDSTGEINDRKTVDPATNTVTFDTLNFTTAGTY
ncbi:MAG: hypothetical protein IKK41_00225, partial [Oscillospiraceae bacterium]|nr:hypothetical protein [Oscillospiraceae bacterium]